MISIEIPVLHGKHLRELFESIRSQSFQDYEVIVVNSGSSTLSDIIKEYGFKEIRENVKLLNARYLAHLEAKGEFALLLDETRPLLSKHALSFLSSLNHDMIIIHEKEIGNSIWIRSAQLDKENIISCNPPEAIKGFALPRYFRSSLLSKSLETLKSNLDKKFTEVIFPDHELIYYEASKLSSDIYVIKEPLIGHYGDSSLSEIIKKYYRYGKSIKVLKGTPYENFLSINRKRRKLCKGSMKNRLLLYLLYIVRGVPFIIGKSK